MFEYKFIEVPLKKGLQAKKGDTINECKNIINEEAKNGWRLKQIISPTDETNGIFTFYSYQIIFEKELK